MIDLELPADIACVSRIHQALRLPLTASEKDRADVRLIIDEVFSNIVKYSGAASVSFSADINPHRILMRFSDPGKAFDPTAYQRDNPELTTGGYGIELFRQVADSIRYLRTNGHNLLTVIKKFEP